MSLNLKGIISIKIHCYQSISNDTGLWPPPELLKMKEKASEGMGCHQV